MLNTVFLCTSAISMALAQSDQDTIVSIPLTLNKHHLNHSQNLGDHLQRIKAKYDLHAINMGVNLSDSHRAFLRKRQSSINLINDGDIGYYLPITMGTPAQSFNVHMDTGSDLLWVGSSSCTACNDKNSFYGSRSSTYWPTGIPRSITYGSGFVSGNVSQETIGVASIKAVNQFFLEVLFEDEIIQRGQDKTWDGLVGLALNQFTGAQTRDRTYTFFQNMVILKQISQGIFAVYMNASINQAVMQKGEELTLGGYNTKYFKGDILWYDVPLIPGFGFKYFWGLPITSFQMSGSYNVLFNPGSKAHVVFDTGCTLNVIDTNSINTLFLGSTRPFVLTQRSSVYYLSCSHIKSGPTLTFSIGGTNFILTSSEYILRDGIYCYLGFQTLDLNFNNYLTWILGGPFLRKYYTIYDLTNQKMGIANSIASSVSMFTNASTSVNSTSTTTLSATISATPSTAGAGLSATSTNILKPNGQVKQRKYPQIFSLTVCLLWNLYFT